MVGIFVTEVAVGVFVADVDVPTLIVPGAQEAEIAIPF